MEIPNNKFNNLVRTKPIELFPIIKYKIPKITIGPIITLVIIPINKLVIFIVWNVTSKIGIITIHADIVIIKLSSKNKINFKLLKLRKFNKKTSFFFLAFFFNFSKYKLIAFLNVLLITIIPIAPAKESCKLILFIEYGLQINITSMANAKLLNVSLFLYTKLDIMANIPAIPALTTDGVKPVI